MRHISVTKSAVAVGTVFAAWHLMWVALVGLGWAARVLNFVLELHFLRLDVQLAPFSAVTATTLIGLTFCVGAMLGAIFAIVWNWLSVASEPAMSRKSERAATAN